MSIGDDWLGQVAQRMKDEMENGNAPTPERITARELVGKYGYAIRGPWINSTIQNRLEELDLRAVPDFTITWQGATISIELDPEVRGASTGGQRPDPVHRIDSLGAAHNRPMRVKADAKLEVATSKMLLHDYSQLPVMDNRHTVKGIISWQSIGARLALGRRCEYVRECMEPVDQLPKVEVPKDIPLFEAIGIIAEQGYVLVRDRESGNAISGIVTATDLSNQFALLAEPFLLAGEIEGHLRNLIHRKFTLEELRESAGGQDISGSADMTLGEYQRLLERPEHWERLKLNIDRREFIHHLCAVRKLRNSIMHFNPEGFSEEDLQLLRDIARFFGNLVKMGAM